jgi:hemolysin activation/secretion protein
MRYLMYYFSGSFRLISVSACLLLGYGYSLAQTAISPTNNDIQSGIDQQRRAAEQERILREQLERRPNVNAQPPAAKTLPRLITTSAETPCFLIQKIELQTDRPEDLETFNWLPKYAHIVDPNLFLAFSVPDNQDSPIGQCLGSNGINTVLTRLQNALVAKGFTTSRVLAIPQDIRTGTLTVQLIVGRIGKIKYSSNAKFSIFTEGKPPVPSLTNALPMREGDILNLRDIEMALENFKRVPTADADIKIEPSTDGGKPGLSNLNITQQQKTPYRASVGLNDAGSTGTGKYGASSTLSLDQLFWANDLFYVSVNKDMFNEALKGKDPLPRSNYGYVLHYSIPFGYWSFETTHSRSAYYQTVIGATRNYVYSGLSFNKEAKASVMLHRDAMAKVIASYKLWQRKSNNYIDDSEIDVQRRITAGYDVGLYYRTLIDQAKQSSFETTWTYREGTKAFGAMPAPEEAFDEGTARPRLLLADASLNLPFQIDQQKFKYTANWRAQWNRTKLLASDRFAIGGRYTVRGFDVGLAAERGYVLKQDFAWTIPTTQTELYLGVDYGQVGGDATAFLAGTSLTGMALGWKGKWTQASNLYFDVFWAQPLNKPATFNSAGQTAGASATWNF